MQDGYSFLENNPPGFEGDRSFVVRDTSFAQDNSSFILSDGSSKNLKNGSFFDTSSSIAELKKDLSIRVKPRENPEAFLVFYPGVPGHLGVLLAEAKTHTYWSWGGASNVDNLPDDRKKYGQPVFISLGEFPQNQVFSLKLQINGLLSYEGIPTKYPLVLTSSLLSASIATGVFYGWDLSKVPKVGDALPTEATASLIAVTALLVCLALAYKQLLTTRKEKSLDGKTFDLSGLDGYNCVGAAKKIMGELVEFSSDHKNSLQELSTVGKYTPFDLAAATYNKIDFKSSGYGAVLEAEVMQFEAHKLFNSDRACELDTPQKQLIHAARQLERQAASAATLGWFPEEAEKARVLANNLIVLAETDSATLDRGEFECTKSRIQEQMRSLHLDLYRRLGNTGSSLFTLACSGAIATPYILSNTGNLDHLADLGTDHTLAVYTAILLVTSLLATMAISKLTGAKSPFLPVSKSATALCDEITEAFSALEKTQEHSSSAQLSPPQNQLT